MKETLETIRREALAAFDGAGTAQDLDALRVKYLGKKGELTAGADADIIAVKGNPLEDPAVLADVSFVMKKGVVYKKNGAPTACCRSIQKTL